MLSQKNPSNIAEFLSCLGSLEQKNGQLFEELANKTTVSEVKTKLLKISEGNKTQSKALTGLGTEMGSSKVDGKQCRQRLQSVCEVTELVLKNVQKKKQINAKELQQFLLALEQMGGAMQFLHIQAETFMFMAKDISQMYNMDMKSFNKHIQEIALQVEDHIQVLEEVKTKLVELTAEQKDKTKHPAFKYQRPDAWYAPKV